MPAKITQELRIPGCAVGPAGVNVGAIAAGLLAVFCRPLCRFPAGISGAG